MDEKEFYKSLNGLQYSDEEIKEYENIKNFTKEDLSRISGAVKSKYGLAQVKKVSGKVSILLDKDEKVEKVIKIRDIEGIERITLFSTLGLTTFKSNDFGVFKMLFFTNKRIFFGDTNYLNELIAFAWVDRKDLQDVEFTTKRIKVKNVNGEKKVSFTRWTKGVICSDALIAWFILSLPWNNNFVDGHFNMLGWIAVFILAMFRAVIAFQQKYLDAFYIVLKDGAYIKCLIASDDYYKCRDYLKKQKK